MIKQFNGSHFLFFGVALAIIVVVCLVFGLLLRKKSKKISWAVIFGLLVTGFVLHFLYLLYPIEGANAAQFLTFTSIGTVCILLFPFVFLCRNNTLRDFMFYIGVIVGFLAMLTPTAVNDSSIGFLTYRHFGMYAAMLCASLLMVICGHHKLNWRRTWRPAIVLLVAYGLILVNGVILMATDVIAEHSNTAQVFGPNEGFYGDALDVLCPKVLHTVQGELHYWPIIWLALPIFVYVTALSFLMSLIFDFRRFGRDMRWLWYLVTFQKNKRKDLPKKLGRINR